MSRLAEVDMTSFLARELAGIVNASHSLPVHYFGLPFSSSISLEILRKAAFRAYKNNKSIPIRSTERKIAKRSLYACFLVISVGKA